MRPDGAGTDERATPRTGRRRPRTADSFERDIIMCAAAFAILVIIVWGGIYLSRRAVMPDINQIETAGQQQP
ncbi:MAG TPA: hypothetical protein VNA16_08845 [Abditibacteriaceae bacterium]|nr:hypothetical protein [Abditibacteriaceae bacterium]